MQLLPKSPERLQGRRVADTECIPAVLQTVFCAETYTRGFLDLPQATGVDFRASCFCHKVGLCALRRELRCACKRSVRVGFGVGEPGRNLPLYACRFEAANWLVRFLKGY